MLISFSSLHLRHSIGLQSPNWDLVIMLGSKEAEEQVDNQVEGKRRLFHCNCDAFSPLPLALELRRITNHTPPLCPLLGSSTNLHHCLWMWGVTASCRILPGFCPSTSGACKSPFTTCFLDSPSLGLGLSSGRSRVLFACSTRVSPEILFFNQPLPCPPHFFLPLWPGNAGPEHLSA